MRRWALLCGVLVICCAAIIWHLDDFAYPLKSNYSDLSISHYPNAVYVQSALKTWGTVPLWSNTILSGYPFASNPLSGLWYFPGWLIFVLPGVIGFNLEIILHLLWGGVGTYLWMRERGRGEVASVAGAIMFAAMPKLLAHFAAGHISMVFAVCWTPWLFWSVLKFRYSAINQREWWAPGGILGLIILADIRWAVYAGLLMGLYTSGLFINRRPWKWKILGSEALGLGLRAGTAVLIATPFVLLLIEYAGLSTRSILTPAESFSYSLPPEKLLGIVIPDFWGYAEWILYPGALGILSLVYSMAVPDLRKRIWPWAVLAVICVIYSLGSTIPGLTTLANLPGVGLLRVPARVLFIWGMTVAVLTVEVIDWLMGSGELPKFDPFFFLVPVIVFVMLMTGGLWWVEGKPANNFIWGTVALLVFGILILLREKKWLNNHVWAGAIVLFLLVDLNGVNWQSIQFRQAADVLSDGREAAAYISKQSEGELFRVYSPSYSLPQQTAATLGLELADGVDPLQYADYANYMQAATGVPTVGYSVTLPPMSDGLPDTANMTYRPDAQLLGLMNVMFIASEFDISAKDIVLVERFGDTRIYQNIDVMPRAWIESNDKVKLENRLPLTLDWSPNKIIIKAEGPGKLTLSEINYPGWRVEVDGERGTLDEGLLRRIDLPEGLHVVVFSYRPWQIPFGFLTFMIGFIGWLFITRPRRFVLESQV